MSHLLLQDINDPGHFHNAVMSGYDEKKTGEALAPVPTTDFGDIQDYPKATDTTHDAVFGEINEDGPNYRDVRYCSELGSSRH